MLPWFGDFVGPMFVKEMMELARRPRYYFARVLMTSMLLTIFCMLWYDAQFWNRQSTPIALMADFAHRLFYGFMWTEFVIAVLLTPLFLFSVVAEERDRNTLDLVFTTDLLDREIVLGKFLSRISVLGLLVMGGLPILALCALFGGIAFPSLFYGSIATLSAVLLCGSITVYYSTISASPLGAILRSVVALVCLFAILPLCIVILGEMTGSMMRNYIDRMMSAQSLVNPIFIFFTAMEDGYIDRHLRSFLGNRYFLWSVISQGSLSAFCLWRAIRRLRPKEALARKLTKLWHWRKQVPMPAGSVQDEPATKKKVSRGVTRWPNSYWGMKVDNPIWRRHRLALPYDRDGYVFKTQRLAICLWLIFFVFLLCVERTRADSVAIVFIGFGWAFVLFFTAIVGGLSFNSDRRRGTLDMILQTTLTPQEVVDGTVLGVLEYPRWSRYACLSLMVLGSFLVWIDPRSLLLTSLTAFSYLALCAMSAVGCSLSSKSPVSAMLGAALLPLLEIMGLPMLAISIGKGHGIFFLFLFPILMLLAWLRYQKTNGTWLFGLYTTFLHLSLCAFLFLWAGLESHKRYGDEAYPMELYHPGYAALAPLEKSSWSTDDPDFYVRKSLPYGNPRSWFHGSGPWWLVHPTFWLATGLAFWISRRELISKFNKICDRSG